MKVTRVYTGSGRPVAFRRDRGGNREAPAWGRYHLLPRSSRRFPRLHRAPRRQFIINLSGQSEIEISDRTKRRFGPGDIFLVDDSSILIRETKTKF